jgi:hypothetical protein
VAATHDGDQTRRQATAAVATRDGLGGPMDGLVEPVHRVFFVFYFIYRGGHGNRLGKSLIYRDLSAKAVAKTALVNDFCPPQLSFFEVVQLVLIW